MADAALGGVCQIAAVNSRVFRVSADSLNNRAQIVRIPGSSADGAILAAANRAVTGPARACAIPLALIVLVVAILVFSRARKRRKDALPTP